MARYIEKDYFVLVCESVGMPITNTEKKILELMPAYGDDREAEMELLNDLRYLCAAELIKNNEGTGHGGKARAMRKATELINKYEDYKEVL